MTEIQKLIEPFEGAVPGCAVMVIQNGVPTVSETRGFADLEGGVAITPDTNFRLASVSKHFTAAAILQLRKNKQLSLGDTLGRFFPQFPDYGKNITITQLLTHTSGLIDYEEVMDKNDTHQIRDHEVLELLMLQDHGYFVPGSKFRYSNGGYCILAVIVGQVSGQSLGNFLRSEFFLPFGMKDTFANEEGVTDIPNRAYGHSRKGSEWIRTDQDTTSATVGDGGIYSSLSDLFIWDKALDELNLFEKQVLTEEKPGPIYYGFGLFRKEYRGVRVQYHAGSSIGFRAGLYRVPGKNITIIFLSNRNEGEGIEFCEKIFGALDAR